MKYTFEESYRDFFVAIDSSELECSYTTQKAKGEYIDYQKFQHEFMEEFVNAMAYSLYEWDKHNITKHDHLLGWSYYYSTAFGGLFYGNQIETGSFKELIPKNQTEIK